MRRRRSLRTRTSHCCCHEPLRSPRRVRSHRRSHRKRGRRKRKARRKRKRWKRRKRKKAHKKKLGPKGLLADRACKIVAAELVEQKEATMQAQVEHLGHLTAKGSHKP